MRFLIVDDDAAYRDLLRYHVGVEWPDAIVDDYVPQVSGLPEATFALGDYDLILLGHPVVGERGLEWLATLRERASCPPVVVFASPSDELLAVDALKAGAASFFPKEKLRHRRFVETIRCELHAAGRLPGGAARAGPSGSSLPRGYRYLKTLHAGEFASVFLAETGDDAREVALKVIRYVPDWGGERLYDRFLQEYELIARLDHPNIVKILDLGIADDHAFIAMEYLPAGRLSDRIGESLEPEKVVPYMYQTASALRVIHASGVLHRDLKPANIMFRADDTLALIDFGLAKRIELGAAITSTGRIFGTPYYMSPEQGHAEPVDERSDIYSLGCIFYEMLTGRRAFTGGSAMSVIYKHSHAPRPRLAPELERFQALLERMLAIDPAGRPQSAGELLYEIAAL